MRWIYISPHLDDAILSAGGLIHEQTRAGAVVEIWTLMCGFPPDEELSPYAQILHRSWGMASAEQVVRSRRVEDLTAMQLVGARPVHFDFLDCIYRRGKEGEWLYSDVFVPPREEEEADLVIKMAQALSTRLSPEDRVVGQLAIGSHVDHVLVRRAVESLGIPLYYIADIPYLFQSAQELGIKIEQMKANIHPVSEAGLNSWVEAIAAYSSQVEVLFGNREMMREQIRKYLSDNGGVRLWEVE